jgi:glutaconate CoA-transferase subunit B
VVGLAKDYAKDFTQEEMMVVAAAREIKDGEVVLVGVGLPLIAAVLAKRTHAPNAILVTEIGVVDARPKRLPFAVTDPCLIPGAAMACSMFDVMGFILQGGYVDVGFLGAAQIDKYGNINTTVIGDYFRPRAYLTGSGGANDIASLAKRTVIVMRQGKQRFVERVDYITSPGYLSGYSSRKEAGLRGGGPSTVITDMGVFRFDDVTKEMYLDTYHPGVSIEEIKQNTGFDVKVSPLVRETEPPTVEEIELLRKEIDPRGIYIKRRTS